MSASTPLCQLNGGCLGCCGHGFPEKQELKEAIKKNTLEFQNLNPQTTLQLLKFRDRAHPYDLRNGLCRNLIQKKDQLLCPLHPGQNQGNDLRINHCDLDHLCLTAQEFNRWGRDTQQKFLFFIRNKNLDSINYSLQMNRGELLQEFKNLINQPFLKNR